MKILNILANLQIEHTNKVIIACLLFTAFLSTGIDDIEIQTSFQEGLPDDLPPIKAKEVAESKFGNTESLIILFKTNNKKKQDSFVTDLRDPRMIRTMNYLEEELREEPLVESTSSVANLFQENPETKKEVIRKLSATEARFYNRDYTATTMNIKLSERMNEENVREATNLIEDKIRESPKYPGVEISVTGLPAIRNRLSTIILTDSTKIIAAASAVILLLLVVARGIAYGPATFLPLFMGLIWTLGAMGLIGLPLTIVTISLASMLLGLGVEYGSFIAERIIEESNETNVDQAVRQTMPNTGKAVLGSSTTDLIGFLALLLASISFLRDLGLTLALGEALTLTGALVLTPTLIIKYRRWRM